MDYRDHWLQTGVQAAAHIQEVGLGNVAARDDAEESAEAVGHTLLAA